MLRITVSKGNNCYTLARGGDRKRELSDRDVISVIQSMATRCNLRAGAFRQRHNGTGSCTSRTSNLAKSRLTYRHGIPKPRGNCGTRCTFWWLAYAGNPASGTIYCPAMSCNKGVNDAHRNVHRVWAACSSMAVASQHAVKTIVCSQLPWCKKQYCLPARVWY